MASRPDRLLFVDVETTGLHSADRIVSFGAIELDLPKFLSGRVEAKGTYLIFDPGRKSHPQAEAVHGYSDWLLRHQEPFADYAPEIVKLLDSCDRVVAHNASFDQRFIEAEFVRVGVRAASRNFFCTMKAYRDAHDGRASLDAVMARMGVPRRTGKHGALEDAWRAMMAYLWLHGLPVPPLDLMPRSKPLNLRDAPPEPFPLPRRRRKRTTAAESVVEDVPNEPEVSLTPEEIAPSHREALVRRLRPLAVILAWIARADGVLDDCELAILGEIVSSEADRLGFDRAASFDHDLVAELAEIMPNEAMLDLSARIVLQDQYLREKTAAWVRAVATADGGASDAERRAIARLVEAVKKAMAH